MFELFVERGSLQFEIPKLMMIRLYPNMSFKFKSVCIFLISNLSTIVAYRNIQLIK